MRNGDARHDLRMPRGQEASGDGNNGCSWTTVMFTLAVHRSTTLSSMRLAVSSTLFALGCAGCGGSPSAAGVDTSCMTDGAPCGATPPPGSACDGDACPAPGCTSDAGCSPGAICDASSGTCVYPGLPRRRRLSAGTTCTAGTCAPQPGYCTSTADCPARTACDFQVHQRALGAGCASHEDCSTRSATCDTILGVCVSLESCTPHPDAGTGVQGATCDPNTSTIASGCREDADCPQGEACDGALALCVASTACAGSGDCPSGEACVSGVCSVKPCVSAGTACSGNTDCCSWTCDPTTKACL